MGDPERHMIHEDIERAIAKLIPDGATILELGSGAGTARLARRYKMLSVEHDARYLGTAESTYIHAPIIEHPPAEPFPRDRGWYDDERLRGGLQGHRYDLLLVDGPPNRIGRGGLWHHRHLFNLDVPIVIDDVHRARESLLLGMLSAALGRPQVRYVSADRHFGVIPWL